jgi:hypothetical protein
MAPLAASAREGIEELAARLDEASLRAAELLAGKSAALKAMIEAAGSELKAAGQTLDSQADQFRAAAQNAAQAPQSAAVELDRQAKSIQAVGEAAAARAEFVLARQERQRIAMLDLLARLNQDADAFQLAMEKHHATVEKSATVMTGEAQRLNDLAAEGVARIDAAAAGASERSTQHAAGFQRDAEQVKQTVDTVTAGILALMQTLREAAANAQALISDSTAEAKRRSAEMVGEAMAQCEQLLRAASSVAEEADKARDQLSQAAETAERHIVSLPGIATKEAQRVRETVRAETEQILDISARAIATLQSRSRHRAGEPEALSRAGGPAAPESMGEGLRGLARRITGPKRKNESRPAEPVSGSYSLSAVLAAADAGGQKSPRHQGNVASLAGLQTMLADLAGDLSDLGDHSADPALWRRYLDGDRAVFARTLAGAMGPESIDRIAALYRDNPRFHDAADTYLAEFESMLMRAREGDRDGFFASTLLSADTGKLYLAIAYALGRLA